MSNHYSHCNPGKRYNITLDTSRQKTQTGNKIHHNCVHFYLLDLAAVSCCRGPMHVCVSSCLDCRLHNWIYRLELLPWPQLEIKGFVARLIFRTGCPGTKLSVCNRAVSADCRQTGSADSRCCIGSQQLAHRVEQDASNSVTRFGCMLLSIKGP